MANFYIIKFIQNLSTVEISIIREHLKNIRTLFPSENKEIKEVKFFEYLMANKYKSITDIDIAKEIQTTDVRHLKHNLYNKVTEALIFDKYISNSDTFNEYDIISFRLKKKLLLFKIQLRVLNQGKTEALNELLNEIIDTAKEYEVYDVLAETLTAKKYFKGIRSGIKEFEKINDEIIFYDYCNKVVYRSSDYYYRLILNNDFIKTFSKKELDTYFEECIKQMEDDYKKTKSQQVNYYLHIIYFAKCEREKNYTQAIGYCNMVISMLKKSKAIYRKERMGFALDNMCQLKIQIGDYKTSAIDAKNAQEYYIKNSLESIISKEQEFYAYIYDQNIPQAFRCIEELLAHSLVDTGEFRKSKYLYYQACVLFISTKYKEALDLLKMSMEIEKDKTRWNISLRILNIMIYIELGKTDEAERALESLRKHVERISRENEVKPRYILIVKLLKKLEKHRFICDPFNPEISKMLKELSKKNSSASWEHNSSELVLFHKWLEQK
ncbi:MAG: tetratricopeptide repeat protein [Bacteroidota bacterium]